MEWLLLVWDVLSPVEWLIAVLVILSPAIWYYLTLLQMGYSMKRPMEQSCLLCREKALYREAGGMLTGRTPDGYRTGRVIWRVHCKHCGARFTDTSGKWEVDVEPPST